MMMQKQHLQPYEHSLNVCDTFPLTAKDWNELWQKKQSVKSEDHDSDFWDIRAKTYTEKDQPDKYTDQFLSLAKILPNESVLDMGCGKGNLALPLAKNGHKVIAADFSKEMLQGLQNQCNPDKQCKNNIEIKHLSWDDNWTEKGIKENSVDVCISSRSIATSDLQGALAKLTSTARRRICISVAYGSSPRNDDAALRQIGIPIHPSYDSTYVIAILMDMGYMPTLSYITTYRNDVFESFDAAYKKYLAMIDRYAIDDSDSQNTDLQNTNYKLEHNLKTWLNDHLIRCT